MPDKPKIDNSTYTTTDGVTVPARIYHLEQANVEYKLIVADFSRDGWSDSVVINQAIKTLAQSGEITVNVPHHVRRAQGRQLSMVNKDGGHSSIAMFYRRGRLYQVQGTVLPSNPDPASSDAVRFQQSLEFINNFARTSPLGPFFDISPYNTRAPLFSR